MSILIFIIRNCTRHPLRSALTALGMALALLAFCFVRTMIDAWYSGTERSTTNRLITRNAISLTFYLPVSYKQAIAQIPGVKVVGFGNWFGGIYRDERFRFQQFAIDQNYLDVYDDVLLPTEQRRNYESDRTGAVIGREIAERYGFKIGDVIQLQGTIFPGLWKFVVQGIYDTRDDNVDRRTMFFHWEYLNDRNKAEINRYPDHVGFYAMRLEPGANPAVVSKTTDALFANSFAETLTETETAFVQSFVSMSSTIIQAIRVMSVLVIGIILLVLTNTMLMSYRERYREYAVLKSIGFERQHLARLVLGESLLIGLAGYCLLLIFLIPLFILPTKAYLGELTNFFPEFRVRYITLVWSFLIVVVVAVLGVVVPLLSVMRLKVTDGLRRIG